jgi:hypothetical protein
MKTLIGVYLICFVAISIKIYAQDSDFILENLKAPSMPSATIIGGQINDINSPKSLKELEAAFFTNYLNSDQNLTIPNNYALEINPFMLTGRKNFNYESYIENDPASNMCRNLSISIATTNQFVSYDSVKSNAIGFSLRTIILNGEPKREVSTAFIQGLYRDEILNEIKSSIPDLIDTCRSKIKPKNIDRICSCVKAEFEKEELNRANNNASSDRKIFIEEAKRIIESIFSKIDTSTTENKIADEFDDIYKQELSIPSLNLLRQKITDVKTNRYGLRLDLNWALALNFPTNDFAYSIVPRWGAWINLSYQSEDVDFLTFIALGRVIINNDNFINQYETQYENYNTGNNYDFGLNVAGEIDRFSMSIECIYRLNTNKITKMIDGEEYYRNEENNTWKYMINLNYNLSDDINISYNLGKNFDSISPTQGDLISGLNINFGFGDIKASDLISQGSK